MLVDAPATTRRLYPRDPGGLGTNALQVLVLLVADPGAEAPDMISRLALSKTSVSLAVKELKEQGLIEEEPVPGDRRRRRQVVTGEGRQRVAELVARARPVLGLGQSG